MGPSGAPGALGLSSNSAVGVTISGRPSPVMSPTAGVVMISAPGSVGSRSLTGKPSIASPSPFQP